MNPREESNSGFKEHQLKLLFTQTSIHKPIHNNKQVFLPVFYFRWFLPKLFIVFLTTLEQ